MMMKQDKNAAHMNVGETTSQTTQTSTSPFRLASICPHRQPMVYLYRLLRLWNEFRCTPKK